MHTEDDPSTGPYLSHRALTARLQALARDNPECVRLESLVTTPEGREVWLLTVGPEPERRRPAVWVDGTMHGTELAGGNVALAIAEAVIALHRGESPAGMPESRRVALRDVLFYICPRLSPDGAEKVLRDGCFTRSAPRRVEHACDVMYWEPKDIDGSGWVRLMRTEDPAGDFIASGEHPGLMLPREIDDPPPYFHLYPEGVIENWDGDSLPQPSGLSGVTDFNRNFPWSWQPEPEQIGAGDHPGSEPETGAVIAFASRHPNLYAWLNLHTFGGVFIRPRIDVPDARMDQADLAIYRQLGIWAEETVGYPTVSGFEEFTYEPEKPLHGDLVEYAYHQRGCLAEVCELWDLFRELDRPPARRFVDHYSALSRQDMERFAVWDATENAGRMLRDWQTVDHPQLGTLEVGGVNPVIGVWNPPPERLQDLCRQMTEYWLRVASLLPRLEQERVRIETLAPGLCRVSLVVRNGGYLPTYGLESSRERAWNEPIRARIACQGCILAAGETAMRELPHLDGWGRGRGVWSQMPWLQRSRGSGHRTTLHWTVTGAGRVTVTVGNRRLGWLRETLHLPGSATDGMDED